MNVDGLTLEDLHANQTKKSHFLVLTALLTLVAGSQLIGFEVVGGDPDKFFRPLKSELVRSLREGQIPLWSDLFGFGIPLTGQSEIGTFYLPQWLIYSLFGTGAGYRLSMFLHQLAGGWLFYALSRKVGASGPGSILGTMIYILGGFPAIQVSKEWAVLGMAWIPSAFLGTEIWLQNQKCRGLAILSVSLGCLALAGHFQMAQMTSLGLFLWVLLRTLSNIAFIKLWPGLFLAVVLGIGISSPQLVLSWIYANEVQATSRSLEALSYYSYPIWSFTEFVFPLWTRLLQGGPEGAYWTIHRTTQFEACQFSGTIGLIYAISALFQRNQWRIHLAIIGLIVFGITLSTMPQWSTELYSNILSIPGMGLFRCPSRYGILLHLGIALLAAKGFGDRLQRPVWLILALLVSVSAGALVWMGQHGFQYPGGRYFPKVDWIIVAGVSFLIWLVSTGLIFRNSKRRNLQWMLIMVAVLELFAIYHSGPTRWGMTLSLPESSQVLMELKSGRYPVMLAGPLENMPVTAGLTTAGAYFGVKMPPANESLKALVELANQADRQNRTSPVDEALIRLGVTHKIQFRPDSRAEVFQNDSLVRVILGNSMATRPLYLRELAYGPKMEQARAWIGQSGLAYVTDQKIAFDALLRTSPDGAIPILKSDVAQDVTKAFSSIDPNAALEFDQSMRNLQVEHNGPVVVVLRRTFDQGWRAVDQSGNRLQIIPVYGGLQAVLIGSGNVSLKTLTKVHLSYWPNSLNWTLPMVFLSILIVVSLFRSVKIRQDITDSVMVLKTDHF